MNRFANRIHPVSLFLLLICALVARLIDLDKRPMHGDEAVNAYKLGEVMDERVFKYDPDEYHGPLFYYLSAIFTSFQGKDSYLELTEKDVRFVAVFSSILLLLLWIIYRKYLGLQVTLLSLLLISFSSPLLFYSRYYIHEMLFVFLIYLSFFVLYDYLKRPEVSKAVLLGITTGLMMATKETWIIILPLLGTAMILLSYYFPEFKKNWQQLEFKSRLLHTSLWLAVLFLIFSALYSAGFTDKQGLLNAFKAVPNYLNRGTEPAVHEHPWYEYIRWLFFFRTSDGNFWTEGFLAISAIAGFIFIVKKENKREGDRLFLLFLSIFSLLLLLVYSIIPYKTPWNLLVFYPGLLTMAAVGMVQVIKLFRKHALHTLVILIILLGNIHILWQSMNLNYVHYSDPHNPWVYAHPTPDLLKIPARLMDLAGSLPEGFNTPIQVIIADDDYWPLPWYMREFKKIGWWNRIPEKNFADPLIITSTEMDSLVVRFIYDRPPPGHRHLYVPLFENNIVMRPGKFLNVYARYDFLPVGGEY